MGRPRIELGAEVETEIRARMVRGESAETIRAALGGKISLPTIKRRIIDFRRAAAVSSLAAQEPDPEIKDAADVPQDVQSGTSLEQIDAWIEKVTKAAAKAETLGNLAALSSLTAKAVSLFEAKRKAMPLPAPDPNENPDLIKLGEQAEIRLFRLVDELFKPDV